MPSLSLSHFLTAPTRFRNSSSCSWQDDASFSLGVKRFWRVRARALPCNYPLPECSMVVSLGALFIIIFIIITCCVGTTQNGALLTPSNPGWWHFWAPQWCPTAMGPPLPACPGSLSWEKQSFWEDRAHSCRVPPGTCIPGGEPRLEPTAPSIQLILEEQGSPWMGVKGSSGSSLLAAAASSLPSAELLGIIGSFICFSPPPSPRSAGISEIQPEL